MVALALSAWIPGLTPDIDADSSKWYQSAVLFGSLYIVALGTGGIKPNVSAFGADQFDESDPQVQPLCPLYQTTNQVFSAGLKGQPVVQRHHCEVRWPLTNVTIDRNGKGIPLNEGALKTACDMQDRLEKKSFFNWFYFAINWGSCLAVTVIVYIQDSVSWAIGFAIPAAAMALAVITFLAGSSLYTHVEPTERCPLALPFCQSKASTTKFTCGHG